MVSTTPETPYGVSQGSFQDKGIITSGYMLQKVDADQGRTFETWPRAACAVIIESFSSLNMSSNGGILCDLYGPTAKAEPFTRASPAYHPVLSGRNHRLLPVLTVHKSALSGLLGVSKLLIKVFDSISVIPDSL